MIQVSVSNVACYFPEVIEYLFVYLAAILIPNHVYSSANEITKVIKKFVILNVKSYNVFLYSVCLSCYVLEQYLSFQLNKQNCSRLPFAV